MKRTEKTSGANFNLDQFISILSENAILSPLAMSCIRGGDGEDDGGEVIIIKPKPTQP